jgi:hypothetical protein
MDNGKNRAFILKQEMTEKRKLRGVSLSDAGYEV